MNKQQIINALQKRGIQFDPNASEEVLNRLLLDSWLTIRNAADEGFSAGSDYAFEMTINGQIGTDFYGDQGYSTKQFQDELAPFKGKRGLLCIQSPGGNYWEGSAIAEMVRVHGNIDTKVLGIAASIADVIFQAGKTRIMPRMAMRMGHFASALFALSGNADELEAAKPELEKTIGRLRKHDNTLATMYATRSGQDIEAVRAALAAEEFMDGDESLEKGYCDQLTDEIPVTNRLDLSHLKNVPQPVLNQFSISAPAQGAAKPTHKPSGAPDNSKEQKMRKQMEALLNEWGVKFNATDTDEAIVALVKAGKPTTPAPAPAPAPQNAAPAPIVNLDDHPTVKAMKAKIDAERRATIRNAVERAASVEGGCVIPVNEIDNWVNDAVAVEDGPTGNPVLNRLAKLEAKPLGTVPTSIEVTEGPMNIVQLNKAVDKLLKPQRYNAQNSIRDGRLQGTKAEREIIATNAKQISAIINAAKKITPTKDGKGELTGQLRDAWDSWAAGIQNSNSMSADLLRQVIFSEIMRAFRREFASLDLFAHNYGQVALQGTDKAEVPYYPLNTTASSEFTGTYAVNANANTSNKEIQIGGIGNGVASPGRGRKYQSLKFTAYELARQPWLNIAQLIVQQAEQLAIDVRGDILGTHIKAANFGNAIWSGGAGAFNKAVFTNYLLNAAIKAFWPQAMRNCVLTPDFFTNLLGDPGLQRVNEAGSDESLRAGIISRLLSFNSVGYDALLPIANFIQGGDGVVTVGSDLNLAGFIAYPSAILIATAPIMPGPATMKLLASYEQVTDDQTGLTFTYQYFGNVLGSADSEIIECTYGSGLGELAALKRIVTAGV